LFSLDLMELAFEPIVETGRFLVGRNGWLAFDGSLWFGSLEIHAGGLVLNTLWGTFTFTPSTVLRVSQTRVFFFPWLRIEHSIPTYPPFILFRSFHLSRVIQRFQKAGFSVEDHKV
jgi:hypothetical protein